MAVLTGSTTSLKYNLDHKHNGGERELNQMTLQQALKIAPPLSNEKQNEINKAVTMLIAKDLHPANVVPGK